MPTSEGNERHIDERVSWFVIRSLPVVWGTRLRRLRKDRRTRTIRLAVNLDAVLNSAVVHDAGFERKKGLHKKMLPPKISQI